MKHILKCTSCGAYTLKVQCPKCNKETLQPLPPKYSPEDKYGKYRRQVKSDMLKKEGLI